MPGYWLGIQALVATRIGLGGRGRSLGLVGLLLVEVVEAGDHVPDIPERARRQGGILLVSIPEPTDETGQVTSGGPEELAPIGVSGFDWQERLGDSAHELLQRRHQCGICGERRAQRRIVEEMTQGRQDGQRARFFCVVGNEHRKIPSGK